MDVPDLTIWRMTNQYSTQYATSQACTVHVSGLFNRCQKLPFQAHENGGASLDLKPTNTHTQSNFARKRKFLLSNRSSELQKATTTSFRFTFFSPSPLQYQLRSLFLHLLRIVTDASGIYKIISCTLMQKILWLPNSIETKVMIQFECSLFSFWSLPPCSFHLTFSISEPPDQSFLCCSILPSDPCTKQEFNQTHSCSVVFSLDLLSSHWLSLCTLFTVKTGLEKFTHHSTFLSIKGYNLNIDLLKDLYVLFAFVYLNCFGRTTQPVGV